MCFLKVTALEARADLHDVSLDPEREENSVSALTQNQTLHHAVVSREICHLRLMTMMRYNRT